MCKFSRLAPRGPDPRTVRRTPGLSAREAACYGEWMRRLLLMAVGLAWLLPGSPGGSPAVPPATAPGPAVGRFLVAGRHLEDRNFRQSVILLVAADETGALGLIVNRPAADGDSGRPGYYFGGPVPAGRPFVLFRSDQPVDGAGHVVDDVYVTVSESVLEGLAGDGGSDGRFRIFLGYSGWGPGQLEVEIGRGDWTLREATGADVFSATPEQLWRRLAPPAAPLSVRLGDPGERPSVAVRQATRPASQSRRPRT